MYKNLRATKNRFSQSLGLETMLFFKSWIKVKFIINEIKTFILFSI